MKYLITSLLFYIVSASCVLSQSEKYIDISGKWMGKLSAQGLQLRVVFNLKQVNGQIKATLDSPDQ